MAIFEVAKFWGCNPVDVQRWPIRDFLASQEYMDYHIFITRDNIIDG